MHGQVAVDRGSGAPPDDVGAAEGGLRVGLDVEQLGRADVLVPRRAARLDAGHPDDDLDGGVGGPLGEVQRPRTSVNRPRTFVIMKWRPTKATSEWPGSMVQVPAAGRTTPSTVRVAVVWWRT